MLCFLKLQGKLGSLATFGPWTVTLFSEVHSLCVFFFLSDTLLDVRGNLEGDSAVGAAIQGIPNLWCSMEDSGLWDGPPLARSPKVTPTQITSAAGVLIRDWTKPIREILRIPGADIHITDNLSFEV